VLVYRLYFDVRLCFTQSIAFGEKVFELSMSHKFTILFHSLLTLSKATCDIYLFRLTGHHACIVIL